MKSFIHILILFCVMSCTDEKITNANDSKIDIEFCPCGSIDSSVFKIDGWQNKFDIYRNPEAPLEREKLTIDRIYYNESNSTLIDYSFLSCFPNLEIFLMSTNSQFMVNTEEPFRFLQHNKNLRRVELDLKFSNFPSYESLKYLNNTLRELSIKYGHPSLQTIPRMDSLRVLELDRCLGENSLLPDFSNFPNLERLYINSTVGRFENQEEAFRGASIKFAEIPDGARLDENSYAYHLASVTEGLKFRLFNVDLAFLEDKNNLKKLHLYGVLEPVERHFSHYMKLLNTWGDGDTIEELYGVPDTLYNELVRKGVVILDWDNDLKPHRMEAHITFGEPEPSKHPLVKTKYCDEFVHLDTTSTHDEIVEWLQEKKSEYEQKLQELKDESTSVNESEINEIKFFINEFNYARGVESSLELERVRSEDPYFRNPAVKIYDCFICEVQDSSGVEE